MKLSKNTLDILKNFSTINSNILVEPGNVIKTVSPVKNVMSQATVKEKFDCQFGIWDLGKFLGTISLFEDPDFSFDDKHVTISGSNGTKVTYYYSEPKLLTTINKDIKMPETVVSFELKNDDFSELQKAAAVLQLPDLSLRSDGGRMQLVALDKKDVTSNNYSIDLGILPHDDHDFEFYFKVENLKLLPGNYNVEVTEKVVSKFTNQDLSLCYWIALESDSRYEG
tara:strand:+ start:1781 stop:2455 length:675 start_codon:yes stop_codon:yes gene_type:complete